MKQMGQLCTLECLFCKSMDFLFPFETQTVRKLNLRHVCFVFYCLDVTAIISKVLIKYSHLEKQKVGKQKSLPTLREIQEFNTVTQKS